MYLARLSVCLSQDWLLLRLLSQRLGNNPDSVELAVNFRITSDEAKAYMTKTGNQFRPKRWKDVEVEVRLS